MDVEGGVVVFGFVVVLLSLLDCCPSPDGTQPAAFLGCCGPDPQIPPQGRMASPRYEGRGFWVTTRVFGDESRVALLGVVGVTCIRLSCGDVVDEFGPFDVGHSVRCGYGFAGC